MIALLYAWTTALNLSLSTPVLRVLSLVCAATAFWLAWRGTDTTDHAQQAPPDRRTVGAWVVLGLVFALTLWTRFSQIRNLVLPNWVDPVHHGLMIRVILERGQVPYSLRPYLPVDHLPYHWGYHVFQAAVLQVSGMALPEGMLWGGQILNALLALTCAGLAAYVWKSHTAGIVAAVVVGLASIFPSYFVSWGRYTHLTGLLMVPALAISWQMWLRSAARTWLVWAVIILAGLSMVHFLVLVLALCLLAVISVVWAVQQPWRVLWSRLLWVGVGACASLLLSAPWLWVLAARILAPAVEKPHNLVSGGDYVALHTGLLWAGQNRLLAALALAGAMWGMRRRLSAAPIQILWILGMIVLANPWTLVYILPLVGAPLLMWGLLNRRIPAALCGGGMLLVNPWLVRLPYLWVITNDVMTISLFVPFSVLIGGCIHLLYGWLKRLSWQHWRVAGSYGLGVVLVAYALWSAWGLRSVINDETILVTPGDRAAIAWVAENTPTDARFLINSSYWYENVDRGVDGGYWLLTLTGRWISTPPSIFTYGAPDYTEQVLALSRRISLFRPEQKQDMYDLIEQEHMTHIYLRTGTGLLTLADFNDSSRYEVVYDHAGVVILAVAP